MDLIDTSEEISGEEVNRAIQKAYTTRDIAEHFGLSIPTITKAAARGEIPGCSKILGRYAFTEEALTWVPPHQQPGAKWGGKKPGEPSGRFKPGNQLGIGGDHLGGSIRGRNKRKTELAFLRTLVDSVDPEDWVMIILKAVEQAKEGEWRARQWLSGYLLGTPIKRVQAEVDVRAHTEFETGERAAAIMNLLNQARAREEGKIVDAEFEEE